MSTNKTDILQHNNQKNEEIEFYNCFQHLQKFRFVWEHLLLNFRYSIELSSDKTKLIKKMTMSKIARKKIFVVESRIWNLEEPATGRAIRPLSASNMKTSIRSILFGYMWYDIHAESLLNIKGSSKNLAAMGMTEKSNFIREFIRYLHKTQRQDNFYSILIGHWIVLYPTLNMQLILLTSKVGRVFLPKFFHDKKVKDFLKHLEYAGEYRTDNV